MKALREGKSLFMMSAVYDPAIFNIIPRSHKFVLNHPFLKNLKLCSH